MLYKIKNFFYQLYSSFIITFLPIKKEEVVQYTYISLMLFSFLFVQNLIRNLKDTLSVNMIGAEANSIYKFALIPLAVVCVMYIYTIAVSKYSGVQIFYFTLGIFLTWFFLFGFCIFPYREYLNMSPDSINYYVNEYYSFRWFIKAIGNWSLGLFYISAEFWQSLVITIVTWQFIMNIFTVEQSQRMFLSFSIISQSGLASSGYFMYKTSDMLNLLGLNLNIDNLVKFTIATVLIVGIIGVCLFYKLIHNYYDIKKISEIELKSNKKHPGFKESIYMVFSSKYMILLALILFCYGMSVNLVEAKWKDVLNRRLNDAIPYFETQGYMLISQGIVTVAFGFLGANLIRFGWTKIAIIPVLLALFVGGMFFSQLIFVNQLSDNIYIIGWYYLVFIKSSKYIFLDNTKELVFKILPVEMRTKGKGSIDLLSNKYGKGAAAALLSFIFTLGLDIKDSGLNITLAIIFCIIMFVWIISVLLLGRLYNASINNNTEK